MSDPEQSRAISIKFTRFPQNLLIPSIENLISFQAINYFNNQEKFKFDIVGENITINTSEDLEQEIQFEPGETKNLDIKLIPTADGYGTLTFNVNWLKSIEYTVKVKKVRAQVSKSKIKEILGRYSITLSKESDDFDPRKYILEYSSKEIKQAEKRLNSKRAKYNESLRQNLIPEIKLVDIDNEIITIAKGYLSNKDPIKALEFALEISDEVMKMNFYHDLIRAYGSLDFDGTIEVIKNLPKNDKRTELIKKLALDQVKVNPEHAPRIAFLIEDIAQREQLIINVIGRIMTINPDTAVKISQIISNELLRVKILFNIIKILYEKNKAKTSEILTDIINILEKSTELNLSENKFKNAAYQIYKDAIILMAELDSTQKADQLLIGFELRDVKDKVAEDVFDLIYEMVNETKIKFDPVPVFSQYYIFNLFFSNINEDINNFSIIGGNISNNVLLKDFNFGVIFLSLFNYNFSIFPLIDRVYTDLKFNNNKTIAYYLYPSRNNLNGSELKVINNTLNQFGLISNFTSRANNILILNLDFIPYLGKPTIIISSKQETAEKFISKISKTLGNSVNIKRDHSLFKGGKTEEYLKQIFSSDKCEIVNLILSYEFINNYEIFKAFVSSLI